MALSPNNTNRLYDGDSGFNAGIDSQAHPSLLAANEASWAINAIGEDGTLFTRPGYSSLFAFGTGKAQGLTLFTPTNGVVNMVAAISGKIWVSPYPFTSWSILDNIQFDPWVDHVAFKDTVQAVANGTIVGPTSFLIMQDGMSRPAMWDGSNNRHLIPGGTTKETVQGLWMEWVGQRLWVARGKEIFASDLYDPLHFTETEYLAEGGSLQPFDGKTVIALARTADDKSLLIGTEDNTTIVAASITDRTLWKTTENFISLLFPGVGFVSGVGHAYLNGELWWMSKEGARRFTQVGATILTSKNTSISQEMMRSYANLSPTLTRICAFSHESFVGFSVPSGDILNRHTWVCDSSRESITNPGANPTWAGIWMGTRPVQWASGLVNGEYRCFHLSQDRVGGIHVWEAFKWNNRSDDGNRIFCSIEGRGFSFNDPFGFKRFKYTDLHLLGIRGQLDLTVEYRGDYGCWKQIADVKLCSKACRQLECNDQNGELKAQSRFVRTQDSKPDCGMREGPYSDDVGTFFQNRIRWYGEAGILKYRSQSDQWQEPAMGACQLGDLDANGILQCKEALCCDEEVDYLSLSRLQPYGYGSAHSTEGSV